MSPVPTLRLPSWLRLRTMILTIATMALVSSCGGGVGTGGTGSFASFVSGTITGFGSVIVNDVRFDDNAARVEDADGNLRSRDELRLGMTVAIDSSPIVDTGGTLTAVASRVQISSEMLGPVAAVDAAAATLRLLGQVVAVDANTLLDESLAGGIAALAPGQLVEGYALWDAATLRYRATRIELRSAASRYHLRGVVSAIDTRTRTLVVGGASFAYSAATGIPADLAVGRYVRMTLQPAGANAMQWSVMGFGEALVRPPEQASVRMKGLINALGSVTSFSVDGQNVNAAGARFPDGTALGPGVRVEVNGTMVGGVLQATEVTIDSDQGMHDHGFDLRGTIGVVNTAARTFMLRGHTVAWSRTDLRLEGGTLADIVPGRKVQVTAVLAGSGMRLDATLIRFE